MSENVFNYVRKILDGRDKSESLFLVFSSSLLDYGLEDGALDHPNSDARFADNRGSSLAVVHNGEFSEETAPEVDDVRCVFTFALKYQVEIYI